MTTDERLDALTAKVEQALRGLALLVNHLGAAPRAAGVSSASGRVASDGEIDDPEWGDKEIRKDPPKWKGASFKGERWSTCPPEYLDALAGFLDWAAGKKRSEAETATGEEKSKAIKYAGYDETDAAKVRAWAKRLRERPADDGGL